MKNFFRQHLDFSLWLFFTALATFVLFFVSADSYFNDLHSRVDSAWFFMCGKAWMNGLVPYVDFADSKGPLLWLIYGIGYLLDHTSYVGVYWISCFWYGLTYFFTYKTADIFLKDTRKSWACAVMMTLAFFSSWYHNEIRAEDFGLLFLVISLYRTCLLLYTEQQEKERLASFAILGACFAALFLIKFNTAAMQAVFILFALVYLLRKKQSVWKPFLYGIGGFAAVSIPFVIYFLTAGNFSAFIQEYLINTFQTVSANSNYGANILLFQIKPTSPVLTYILEWGELIYTPQLAALLVLILIGGILFLPLKKEFRWMPMLASSLIFALTVYRHFYYYFNSCSFLLIFLFIGIFSVSRKTLTRRTMVFCALVAIGITIPAHILAFNFKTLFFNDNINQRDYYRVSYIISQVEHPKIINAFGHEYGFGVLAEALPGGKYWTGQVGMTQGMRQAQREHIFSGNADFIIIHKGAYTNPDCITEEQLAEAGYHECCRIGEGKNFILLTKWKELDIPDRVVVSRKDLFFKKNPFRP